MDTQLATCEYVRWQHHLSVEGKQVKEYRHTLFLLPDRIQSDEIECFLTDIFDVSYRMTSSDVGFLYIHTTEGIVSLYINEPPHPFINAFHTTTHL
ncbi:hypothetical protein [Aureibacillus halotolerans]|uniref:Uncharacterized protein n=1 Tax=Aureibacillus halotolerans TaxID=1508390 RepID=A0A4R6U9V2_9BACI|nr:hypothetical protein [Aureibacillus halotolerans]TDQ41465.1 hypothetical protein EV213_10342 [Aureibacillus halotolerans]